MGFLSSVVDLFLHLDQHLNAVAADLGPWLYLILFAVVFCETGLVVTPFLPGDSLLFAVGALAATAGSQLSVPLLAVLLIVAAVSGDAVNYWIGYLIGPKVFQRRRLVAVEQCHLRHAWEFYQRHGGKTIVLARFVPIVRTFAPFVAGVGRMQYRRFWLFNFSGGVAWVLLFLLGGFYFGTAPFVQRNFHLVILAIIVLSVLPIGIEWLNARRKPSSRKEEEVLVSAETK